MQVQSSAQDASGQTNTATNQFISQTAKFHPLSYYEAFPGIFSLWSLVSLQRENSARLDFQSIKRNNVIAH